MSSGNSRLQRPIVLHRRRRDPVFKGVKVRALPPAKAITKRFWAGSGK